MLGLNFEQLCLTYDSSFGESVALMREDEEKLEEILGVHGSLLRFARNDGCRTRGTSRCTLASIGTHFLDIRKVRYDIVDCGLETARRGNIFKDSRRWQRRRI